MPREARTGFTGQGNCTGQERSSRGKGLRDDARRGHNRRMAKEWGQANELKKNVLTRLSLIHLPILLKREPNH